jgi:hypothetical protein
MKRFRVLAALALAAAAACKDTNPPQAGELIVSATSVPGARAVLLRINGPVTDAVAAPGTPYRVFATPAGDTMRVVLIAPTGTTIATGPLLRITVPDAGRASSYSATALQASSPTYTVVPPAFSFTVLRP